MENSATIDRFKNLPEDVLRRIVSFIPINLVVNTMLLSKKWARLCRSLPVLRFDDKVVENQDSFFRFCRFVDVLMCSPRSADKPIKTLHLKCKSRLWTDDNDNDTNNINRWVETAIRHCLEDLDLSMERYPASNVVSRPRWFTLTPNIFCCQTLVVLKLSKLRVKGNILSVEFRLLKTLHLEDVILQHKKDLQKLISGAPLLQDLHTSMYYEENGDVQPEGFKLLSNLLKADVYLFDVPFNAIYNVKFLRIVKIWERHVDAYMNSYYQDFPVFENLIHLELEFYRFSHGWDDIVKMLHHCPKLQVLSIIKARALGKGHYKFWEYPNSVPECVVSHLRSCTITSSCFLEDDLKFATYILYNAPLLQFMTINVCESLYPIQKQQISDELFSCLKISPECKLSLEFKDVDRS